MRPFHLLFIAPLASLAFMNQAQAFDSTTQGVVISGYVTSKITSAPFDNKVILAAQDDAAAFVATDGLLRGAHLESALHQLRKRQTKLHASDLELAEAILVQ